MEPPSNHPSPTLVSLSSSSALPPAILSRIFRALPSRPSSERNASLAALSLVNRSFLRIARPLLFHDFWLDWRYDFRPRMFPDGEPLHDLLENEPLARLIKTVRIHRNAHQFYPSVLDFVLSHAKNVESIRLTKKQPAIHPLFVEQFLEGVVRNCPKLRHLELPEQSIEEFPRHLDLILSAFPNLESFRGHLVLSHLPPPPPPQPDLRPSPPFHLKRLVLRSPVSARNLSLFLASSHHSLTTLSIRIDSSSDAIDLSGFNNLSSLHLTLSQRVTFFYMVGEAESSLLTRPEGRLQIQRIVETARHLPISDFTLSLGISSAKTRESLQWVLDDDDLDTLVFWSRDPLRPRPQSRRSPVKPPKDDDDFEEDTEWSTLANEAQLVVEEAGLKAIRAVAEYGVEIGVSSERMNHFDDDYLGDSETERGSDEESDDGFDEIFDVYNSDELYENDTDEDVDVDEPEYDSE